MTDAEQPAAPPAAAAPAPRPAPQYGEYATLEEQREIIRRSGGEPAAPVPSEPVPVSSAPASPAPALAAAATTSAAGDAASAESVPRRRGDRLITVLLLLYGLVTVVVTIPQFVDYAGFAATWLDMAGIDAEFTATASGRAWGTTAAVVFALGWILTAFLAWRSARSGRLSWWIAVVGAVVTFIVVSLCMSVPILGDPAVIRGLLRS